MNKTFKAGSMAMAQTPFKEQPKAKAMKTAVKILSVVPLMVLFFDYAVAMQKVEPAGTRRMLRTISKQTDAGTFPTLKPVWELGIRWNDTVET